MNKAGLNKYLIGNSAHLANLYSLIAVLICFSGARIASLVVLV